MMPTYQDESTQFLQRAEAVYNEKLRATLNTPENRGKFLALEPDSGAYEVRDELRQAADWVRACCRGKRVYATRIGQETFPNRGGFPCIITALHAAENKNAPCGEEAFRPRNNPAPTEPEELAKVNRRGRDVYETKLRAALDTPENYGKTLVIDPDSADYEMGENHYALLDALRIRHPDKLSYSMRIGYAKMAHALGARSVRR